MTTPARPHSLPAELAKDILGKLDNARAMIERAQAVAERGQLTATGQRLQQAIDDFEASVEAVQAALLADVRQRLSDAPTAGATGERAD